MKSYNSAIIAVLPKDVCDIDGKTGGYIIKYMDKVGISQEYLDAYKLCKIYPSWYFYYGEMKEITSI